MKRFSHLLFWGLALSLATLARAGDIESEFLAPPDSARPWVYWFFMDGNLSREGITADLEAMKRVGPGRRDHSGGQRRRAPRAGRFHEPQVAGTFRPRRPRGRAAGPADRRRRRAGLVRHRRALGQAGTIDAAPGGQRDGRARARALRLVAAPPATAAALFSATARSRRNWPRPGGSIMPDVAVLAFPTPQGKARIADIDEKALYHRDAFSSGAGVKPFLPEPDATTQLPVGAVHRQGERSST